MIVFCLVISQKTFRNIFECLTMMFRVREVPGSNISLDTSHLRGFPWFSSVPRDECRDGTLKLGHDRFLPNTLQFIVQLSPVHSTRYIASLSH
jgi:hypothetical protein